MPRFPSDDPPPRSNRAYTESMKQNLLATRERGLREIEEAEQNDDRRSAFEARARVRAAQAEINRFGLDR